jgi:hypothetical protein
VTDPTEGIRRELVHAINTQTESNDPDSERERLQEIHGEVWSTEEVSQVFEIEGFMAPFVVATHRELGIKGTLMFQHSPRFYFSWTPN